jgi:glycosyltransferase involved in cell wall biosynthesis
MEEVSKKIKVMVATNIYQIDPAVYSSHLEMFYKLGKVSDEIEVVFFGPWRSGIAAGRNNAAQHALLRECDYLLFYDDDMYFPSGNDIIKMIRTIRDNSDKIHILQALAYIRGYPFHPMCFKLEEIEGGKKMTPFDDYEKHIEENGLVKCDAVGCCATIIDTKLFKLMPEPWFVTGKTFTEDIFFCVKALQFVENVGVYMDTTIEIGHLLEKIILTKCNKDIILGIHNEHDFNQLFLPDKTFVPLMKLMDTFGEDKRDCNPLENIDNFVYPQKKEEN